MKVLRYYSITANGAGPRIVVEFAADANRKQSLQRAKAEYMKVYGWLPRGLSFKAFVEDETEDTGDREVIRLR